MFVVVNVFLLCEFLNKFRPDCETRVMLFSFVKGIIIHRQTCVGKKIFSCLAFFKLISSSVTFDPFIFVRKYDS